MMVAWHEMPGKRDQSDPSRRARYDGSSPRVEPSQRYRAASGVPGSSCHATVIESLRDDIRHPRTRIDTRAYHWRSARCV
jgi:hypothetical protein